jgi:uncharacterized protein (TIGR03083 family)
MTMTGGTGTCAVTFNQAGSVGYNAAALCRLMDWAATGVETPMYPSAEHRDCEIKEGATLSAAALRNLFDHTVARLDEKWRHLPESRWAAPVRTAQSRTVPASETMWMRTREVWIHAVDLDNGAQFSDVPGVVLESLLADIVEAWRRKELGADLVLEVTGAEPIALGGTADRTVRGIGDLCGERLGEDDVHMIARLNETGDSLDAVNLDRVLYHAVRNLDARVWTHVARSEVNQLMRQISRCHVLRTAR